MAPKVLAIPDVTAVPAIDIALDTVAKAKQAIIFVSTKRGAESLAEQIASKIRDPKPAWSDIAVKAQSILSSPTKQCTRLAKCLRKGIAFHHAGLASGQRDLIENAFRSSTVCIICATPTLAMGVDLPAFRTVIRDLSRYTQRGMQDIPVLEYEQMSGRAGRPGKEEYGEAICIAQSKEDARDIREKYIEGTPEEIDSKLAVEPVLRTYVLSLIASGFVKDVKGLEAFFAKTFYAHQYRDMQGLRRMLSSVVKQLQAWEFLKDVEGDFVSADKLKESSLEATPLGARVAQLYLDPLTARQLLDGMQRSTAIQAVPFTWLHLLASQLEMRPFLTVRVSEYDDMNGLVLEHEERFLSLPPSEFEEEYSEFLQSVKTAKFMQDWIDERTEEQVLEDYNVRPGELHAKLEIADWLCYSMEELAKVTRLRVKDLAMLRLRLKYGAREELLPLLRLKGIGRVRARNLFKAGVKAIADVKSADLTKLSQLLGKAVALDVKKQVGQDLSDEQVVVKPGKRKGQHSLEDY